MVDVTVVLPIYNAFRKSETYLTDAIDSVLAQDYDNFELIIVDDGSTEDYSQLIDKYNDNKKVKFFRKQNGGQSSARNYGASLGSGQYLAFIDQDDVWYKNRLRETVRAFKLNQKNNCVLVYSDLDRIDSHSRIVCRSFLKEHNLGVHPKTNVTHLLGINAYILPGTMLVNREQFLSLGGFNETLSGYEDDELALRFFQKGSLIFVNKPLIQWRIYQESYSYSERMDKSFSKYFNILVSSYPDDKNQGEYWVRDQIAPRFYYGWLHTYKMALLKNSKDQAKRAREGLSVVSKHLSLRRKSTALIASNVPYGLSYFIYKTKLYRLLRF
jgi:Glycosyltransferases, probably involved in cell wall biogenesis